MTNCRKNVERAASWLQNASKLLAKSTFERFYKIKNKGYTGKNHHKVSNRK